MKLDELTIKPNDDSTFTICARMSEPAKGKEMCNSYDEKRYTAESVDEIGSVIKKIMSASKGKINDLGKLLGADMEDED